MKKSAVASPRRTVIVDAGPLKAAIDRGDADHAWAVRALRQLVARMDIVPVAIESVFNEAEGWAPRMDFADACAVVLARNYERAFVLTTDFRDFSSYRVPFASSEGAFYV